jgi:hypothetical protein
MFNTPMSGSLSSNLMDRREARNMTPRTSGTQRIATDPTISAGTHIKLPATGSLRWALAAFALLAIPVYGFQVEQFTVLGVRVPGERNHEQITENGLGQYLYTAPGGTTKVGFTQSAIADVVKENTNTDTVDKDIPFVHFDDELVTKGENRLTNWEAGIVSLALAGNYQQARQSLGSVLHTVQDFYAHSSWVDQGNTQIAALWGNAQKWSTLLTPPAANASTCIATGLSYPVPFTTGFFDTSQLLPTSPYTAVYLDSGDFLKCKHGFSINTLVVTTLKTLFPPAQFLLLPIQGSDTVVTPGINKDRHSRPYYPQASSLAEQATTQYVSDIVVDIGNNASATTAQKAAAICGLLGQPSSACAAVGGSTWVYTGNPLSGGPTSGFIIALAGPVTATLTFSQPIPAGFTGQIFTGTPDSQYISAWSMASSGVGQFTFTCGQTTSTNCNYFPSSGVFTGGEVYFTNGQITSWFLQMSYSNPTCDGFDASITTFANGPNDPYAMDAAYADNVTSMSGTCRTSSFIAGGANSGMPGTWQAVN